eukprot:TRINITY_DN11534_c0_g1_i2.p1 TRINITY_DN11534_c0_g1~~TRINITY_DN11534_c0_g1_i2.p1  ORF type:complete len:575 (+),score=169.40 TRINITY_DN11534_c0_g1_i2:224-1726(+)
MVSPITTPIAGFPAEPLYGLGLEQMEPLYTKGNESARCADERVFGSDYCKAQATNLPLRPSDPDFVVFVLNAEHVRAAVSFARRHRLCIGVAGSGHEMLGRNQPFCDGGSILIRTTLMRSKEADLEDESGLGAPSLRFGAGMIFSEAHEFAASHGKVIASGSCATVGLVGWTLGGGHGPLVPSLGMGADNLLSVDMVLANGRYVTVTADGPYADLFRALKGGGGSTWGIITHITVRAHPIPADGFTVMLGQTAGNMCDAGRARMRELVNAHISYNNEVTKSGAAVQYVVSVNSDDGNCTNDSWIFATSAVVSGGPTHEQSLAFAAHFQATGVPVQTLAFPNWYQAMGFRELLVGPTSNYIDPWRASPNGLASALVAREEVQELSKYIIEHAETTVGSSIQVITSALTGNIGSPQAEDNSLSEALRKSVTLYFCYEASQTELRERLGTQTYFSESSYEIRDIGRAYWGSKYWDLLRTKRKYDPRRIFCCRGCIGTRNAYDA